MVSWALKGMSSAVEWTVGFAVLDDSTVSEHLGRAMGKICPRSHPVAHALGSVTAGQPDAYAGSITGNHRILCRVRCG